MMGGPPSVQCPTTHGPTKNTVLGTRSVRDKRQTWASSSLTSHAKPVSPRKRFRSKVVSGKAHAYRASSKPLTWMRAHHQFRLRELPLEPLPQRRPPGTVQLIDHHLVDDNVVSSPLPTVFPYPFRRRARVRGQAPEARRQLSAQFGIRGGGDW